MPDTIRSQAAILALLADNTTGDISPQDLRDAIVSLYAETPASMTVAAFDTETTSGTLNPNYRRVVQLSDSPYTCIWNGSAWEYYAYGFKCTRMAASDFTQVNTAGGTLSHVNGVLTVTSANSMTAFSAWSKTLANASSFTITAFIDYSHHAWSVAFYSGLFLRESAGTKLIVVGPRLPADLEIVTEKWTDYSTSSSTVHSVGIDGQRRPLDKYWARFTVSGGTLKAFISFNGYDWWETMSEAVGTFITPAQFGVCYRKNNTGLPQDTFRILSLQES